MDGFTNSNTEILERIAVALEEQNKIKEKQLYVLINIHEALKYLR